MTKLPATRRRPRHQLGFVRLPPAKTQPAQKTEQAEIAAIRDLAKAVLSLLDLLEQRGRGR